MTTRFMRSAAALAALTLLCLIAACNGDKGFTITGEFKNMSKRTVRLREIRFDDRIVLLDSVETDEQGRFELHGTTPQPGFFQVVLDSLHYVNLSLHNERVKVTGDFNKFGEYTVAGSPASASIHRFTQYINDFVNKRNTLEYIIDQKQQMGDDSSAALAMQDMSTLAAELTRYIEEYADTTKYVPNALFSVRWLDPNVEMPYLEAFVQNLPARFKNDAQAMAFVKYWSDAMAARKAVENGEPQQFTGGPVDGAVAPAIRQPTPEGRMLSLESLRGKYVLVDFWASWCPPCRAENPNVVAAYNKFKDKGFTVFGVSLDDDKEKWMDAVAADGLAWPQVSDLKGWESIPARDYRVRTIPMNFLLDKEGRIIDRDLRGKKLEARLSELLN